VVQSWGGLSQEVQHVVFEAAVAASGKGDEFRDEVTMFLHEHHCRTR
jgi:hypothetical protein